MDNNEFLEIAKFLIEVDGFRVNVDKPYLFVSNLPSPCYIDCRKLISFPEIRRKVINFYIYFIEKNYKNIQLDVIVGAATAGIPFASLISERLNLPMAYVRKSEKEHGSKEQVSGYIKNNSNTLIIEDLITFGSSLVNFRKGILSVGARCDYCLSIVSYGHIKISKVNKIININYLISGETIADYALKDGFISKIEHKEIKEWLDDPRSWTIKKGFDWSKVKFQSF